MKNIRLKEITPKTFICTWAGCPAVFEIEGKGKLIIVGPQANLKKLGLLKRVGKNEGAVIVDKEMLRRCLKK